LFIFNIAYTNGYTHDNDDRLRLLLFAESFPSFTSGITRRFKEIIRRLAKRKHYIHVITGCKVCRKSIISFQNRTFILRMQNYGLKEMIIYKNM
jgi:hypothetical protein